jgi:pyruvate dehydrogenase E2 component (dihydrolipoamide acetyltransferase)
VQTEQGLYVPVLHDVDRKQIGNLQAEYLSLVERVKSGKSTSADLTGGTFTISNLGEENIESFMPVINLPECAILGVGAILPRPVVENANVVIRNMMKLTLVFDHRLVDGKPAGRFLYEIKEIIEKNDY